MRDKELSELSPDYISFFKKLQKYNGYTLYRVVEELEKETNLNKVDIIKKIYVLIKKGFLDIEDYKPARNIVSYLFNLDSIWFYAVTILVIATIMLVYYAVKPPLIYVRYVLGSLYVLYLPGYSLIEALYPRGDELEPLERLALSIGLSLALVPLVGLLLNYTPWGIRLVPVTISLAILTEGLSVIALIRKYRYYLLRYS